MLTPQAASAAYPGAQHPLLIWNVLHRAGASQYHGHAQVLLSDVAFPTPSAHTVAAAAYEARHGVGWLEDHIAVADELGLLHTVNVHVETTQHPLQQGCCVGSARHAAWVTPALAPAKDMEVVVCGSAGAGLDCPALHTALYRALRALIDVLGVQTWNLAIYNVPLPGHTPAGPIMARYDAEGAIRQWKHRLFATAWCRVASLRRWQAILGPWRCLEGPPSQRQTRLLSPTPSIPRQRINHELQPS